MFDCRNTPPFPRAAALTLCLLLAGCQTVHEVKLDAIRNPALPAGEAYRLVVLPTRPAADPALAAKVGDLVRQVLASRGMYEAPAGSSPEAVIFLETGVGPGQRKFVYSATVEPHYRVSRKDRRQVIVHEKFIKLSAREPARESGRGRGEELWSVHVLVEDEKDELAPYLPVLTAALVDHIDDNFDEEKTIRIRDTDARAAVDELQKGAPRE